MKFSEIPGNLQIKNKLIRTVLDHRVSHAQLFFGPENSSKLALAIAYAQFINCTGKQAATPLAGDGAQGSFPGIDSCGVCPSCIKYQKLVHPDLHFIYPVANTKKIPAKAQSKHFVEDWRNFLLQNNCRAGLQQWYEAIGLDNKQGIINTADCNEIITTLSYMSYESEYKVMILWMVEKLYHAAAPKILKILEEPPDKTLFILISGEPDQIIRTIVSRTLMVRIPDSGLPSNVDEEEDTSHLVTFRQWMRACYEAKVPELIKFTGEISKAGREKQKRFLHYSLRTIAACATWNYLRQMPAGACNDETTFIGKFSPYIKPGNLVELNTLFNDAIYHIERNAHAATLFMDLSLKLVPLIKPGFVAFGK